MHVNGFRAWYPAIAGVVTVVVVGFMAAVANPVVGSDWPLYSRVTLMAILVFGSGAAVGLAVRRRQKRGKGDNADFL